MSRLDVGFVPAEVPGGPGSGAVHTSTLLVERLSRHHDLTVYVASQHRASDADLPARDRVEYVVHDDLRKLPHPLRNKQRALRRETDALERHDLVHSYSAAFIPVLADLDVPTLSTMNSYLPVCPKADMMYHGERKCSGPGPAKCVSCIAATGLKRRQGLDHELRSGYVSLGQVPFVQESIERAWDVDAYHAISPHLVEDFGRIGFPDGRTRVVPHFYDESFLDQSPREGPDDTVRLVYVGALMDFKGVDVLLRALSTLESRGTDAELRVAGKGPYGDRLRDLAADLGVDDRVEWLGYVDHDELVAEYRGADAFVYPGLLDEPFGRVLLEALATRTPVVASDVGSMDYIVGPGGVLVEKGDAGALADGIERLAADYDRYLDAIPDHVEQFAPGTVESAFGDLYRAVASGEIAAGGE